MPGLHDVQRAYVHHLVKSGEILGAMLMTQHNLWFYQRLMQGLRDAIAGQRLQAFAGEFWSGIGELSSCGRIAGLSGSAAASLGHSAHSSPPAPLPQRGNARSRRP